MNRTVRLATVVLIGVALCSCSSKKEQTQNPHESSEKSGKIVKAVPPSESIPVPKPKDSSYQDVSRIVVSKETTFFEGPLKEDGTVDYVAALNQLSSEGVTPANNAAVLYWRAFGPEKIAEEFREPFLKLLGIETAPLEGEYFISLGDYLRREKSELAVDEAYDLLGELRTRPWSAEEHPVIAAWLKTNEQPFKLLIEGSKRSRYYAPLTGDTLTKASSLLASSGVREIGRGLPARAMLRLEGEGADAAWEDLSTSLRIARHYAQSGNSLVELLVGIAVAGVADESCRALASYADVPVDLQRRIDRELLNFGTFGISDSITVFERCSLIEVLTDLLLKQNPKLEGDYAFLPSLAKLGDPARPLDVNVALRVANGYFDRLAEVKLLKDYASQLSAHAELEDNARKRFAGDDPVDLFGDSAGAIELVTMGKTPKERGARAGAMLFHLVGGTWDPVLTACQRGNDNWQLTRLTFAGAAYRTENGHYPDTLAELTPKYTSTVGRSSLTGEGFFYQRFDPSFVLATAGPRQTKNVPRYAVQVTVAYDYRACNDAKQKLTDLGWQVNDVDIKSDTAKVTDKELRLIGRIPAVEWVWIDAFAVTNDGLKPLAILPRLSSLSLYDATNISVNGLKHLEDSQRLTSLSLNSANISNAETGPIASLANLQYLDLSESRITDNSFALLSSLKKLKSLNVGKTNVSDQGMQAVNAMQKLEGLNLDDTAVGDATVGKLRLPELTSLSLSGTELTAVGVATIVGYPKLESLNLDRTKITDEGLKSLAEAKTLTFLSIQETNVSTAAIERLKQALPKCEVNR